MKFLVAIGVILLCAQSTLTDFIANCTDTPERIATLIETFSIFRRHAAETYQIANMHELKYDPSLAKFAEGIKSCDDLKHGSNYRIANASESWTYDVMKSWVQKTSKKKFDVVIVEDYHPLQTGFINCHLTTHCLQKHHRETTSAMQNVSLFDYIIIYGPRGTFTEKDFKYGPPGSQCPHGKANDTFCAIGSGSDSESRDENGDSKTGNGGQADESAQSIGSVLNLSLLVFVMIIFVNV